MDAKELLRKVGNPSQLGGVRRYTLAEGRGTGASMIDLWNRGGLRAALAADLCLDLYELSYKGVNLAFHAKTGLSSGAWFNGAGNAFSSYFRGGMLYTCGLTNTGPDCVDGGRYCPEHGAIGMLPAEQLCVGEDWDGPDPGFTVSGTVRESVLCAENLALHRRVFLPLEGGEIHIRDRVENREPQPVPHMMLYHINAGYPLLDENARLYTGAQRVTGRTNESADAVRACCQMGPPRDDKEEEVFFHYTAPDDEGDSYAVLVNEVLGLALYIRYSGRTLPVLTEWKNLCSHDYVLGIEPGNSFVMGRVEEREHGTLPYLGPYESVEYAVDLGVLEGWAAIEGFLDAHF